MRNRLSARITAVTAALLWLLLSVLPTPAAAQFGDPLGQTIGQPEQYVTWTSSAQPDPVGPQGTVVIELTAALEGDWKMYALDSSLPSSENALGRPYGVTISYDGLPEGWMDSGNVGQARPTVAFDENFSLVLPYFKKEARFFSGVTASGATGSGSFQFAASIRHQICSDSLGVCLRPATASVPVALDLDGECADCTASADLIAKTELNRDVAAGEEASGGELRSGTTDFDTFRSGGLMSFLLLAMGAGLVSLLTPCVFPMIPLTVSYFTKHAEDRATAVRLASAFGGAIVATFTLIGVVMAVVVGAAGAQTIAANPWVNLFIAAVLVGFALSLLGLYELRLPSGLLNAVNRAGREASGLPGVIFMGLTLTLVSFSCTAPFVGGILAAASGGTWAYPLAGMVVYSATFAAPFILLALFPNWLNRLPGSGNWMNAVKVTLGFVELAAAIKFLSNADLVWGWGLISRPLGIALTLTIFAITGLYLLGKLRLPHEEPVRTIGVGRLFASIAFFVVALYMLPGLLGAPLNKLDAYLPPRRGTDVSIFSLMEGGTATARVADEESWHVDDMDAAFEEGRERGVPVFVDFTGYTCTNCREMEANVFPRPRVASRFETDYVKLRLYTDGLERGDEFMRYQMKLTGTPALPTYAVVDPESGELLARRSGLMDVDEFVRFLDAGSSSHRNRSVAAAD